ncbi:unnamed protein product [Lepeophtheirus salmonis]|uniref:(salmon louse) hypothetical protein n=1 Tax=Lepeophtheirus salmonis TaxID=72036 RepID=A0A7R8CR59_LEPSM|nr:unnamed protein product [Lepeophtheirus salmonis]CAF2902337.1 unnamed protein product [Lepeophtheirus salmonis]
MEQAEEMVVAAIHFLLLTIVIRPVGSYYASRVGLHQDAMRLRLIHSKFHRKVMMEVKNSFTANRRLWERLTSAQPHLLEHDEQKKKETNAGSCNGSTCKQSLRNCVFILITSLKNSVHLHNDFYYYKCRRACQKSNNTTGIESKSK